MVDPDEVGTDLVVVTGLSGGGRSTVARALENVGFYVVDNLPQALMLDMAQLAFQAGGAARRTAMVLDVRSRAFSTDLAGAVRALKERGFSPRVVFVDADDEVLIRRFESVRRSHPLQGDGRLADGIAAERKLLEEAREQADVIIDTSHLNVNQLRRRVEELFGGEDARRLRITVLSFGFKYGLPPDADYVLDARFLPNPFWVPELREHTGLEEAVSKYVLGPGGRRRLRGDVRRPDRGHRARLRAGGQALPHRRGRLHRRQAPQRGDRRGADRAAARHAAVAAARLAPRPGARVTAGADRAAGSQGRSGRSAAAARGRSGAVRCGGLALAARLRRPRELELDITAIVTVGDDGGSSGRLRAERDALHAAGRPAPGARRPGRRGSDRPAHGRAAAAPFRGDAQWWRAGRRSTDSLAGHAVGNLLLLGLMEMLGDPVEALDHAAAMVGAQGRVLPMARHAVGIEADVLGADPSRPGDAGHGARSAQRRGGARARRGRAHRPGRPTRLRRRRSRRSPPPTG